MRRLGIVVGVTALLLSGCSGDDGTDTTSTPPTPSATESSSAPGGDSTTMTGEASERPSALSESTTSLDRDDDPADTGDDPTGGSETDGEGQTGEPTADQGTAAPPLDRPSAEILEEAGWLTDGKITIGPVGPQDEPEIDLAMCDYLFGSPEQVAQTVGVQGTVELAAGESGFAQLGGTGGGVRCLYLVDGAEAFGAIMWNKELEDGVGGDSGLVLQEQMPGGDIGIVAINPDIDTVAIDEDTARAWLQDADTRWGGQSV